MPIKFEPNYIISSKVMNCLIRTKAAKQKVAFENALQRMDEAKIQGSVDQSALIKKLDPKQRKVLELFQEFTTITSQQIGELFGFKPRTSAAFCANWITGDTIKNS